MNVLVFDIETVPDIEASQKIYKLEGLDDESTSKALLHLNKQKTGADVLPLHLQKIAAISVVYRGMGETMDHEVSVHSLGDANSSEETLLSAFFDLVEQRSPTLVSWNGIHVDVPVLHYRTLKNEFSTPNDWDNNRHINRHIDLMDVLSNYNSESTVPLNHIATLLGFPYKTEMSDSEIREEYLAGNITGIRNHSETNALNTYLIYLRYQLMRGDLNRDELESEFNLLRNVLDQSDKSHLVEFSDSWKKSK